MIPQSRVAGRVKIQGDALDNGVFCFKDGSQAIVNAIYKIDSLLIGNATYSNHIKTLSI